MIRTFEQMGALLLLVAAALGYAQPVRGASAEAAACTPGEPVLALSYLPLRLLLTPDRRALIVVDQGHLTLRDPDTLKLIRVLLPRIDRWQWAELSKDGATLKAGTFDKMVFELRTADWSWRRLPDEEGAGDLDGEMRAMQELVGRPQQWASNKAKADWERWRELLELPKETLDGATATAVGVELDQLMVADDRGVIRLISVEKRAVTTTVSVSGKPRITLLSRDADGYLAGTSTGEALLFDRQLTLLQRVQILDPPRNKATETRAKVYQLLQEYLGPQRRQTRDLDSFAVDLIQRVAAGTVPPDPVRQEVFFRLLRMPERGRLAWISSSFELGVYDLKRGAHQVRMPSSGIVGASAAVFTSESEAAILTQGALQIFNVQTQASRLVGSTSYVSAVALSDGKLLASREDGLADVIRASDGKVERSVCLADTLCLRKQPDIPTILRKQLKAQQRPAPKEWAEIERGLLPRAVQLVTSRDGRFLVVHSEPQDTLISAMSDGDPALPGHVSVWDRAKLQRLATLPWPNRQCESRPAVSFPADGRISICGQDYSLPGLQPIAESREDPDQPVAQSFGRGATQVQMSALEREGERGRYPLIKLVRSTGEALGQLAGPDELDYKSEAFTHRRGALRTNTLIDVTASGDRFLLAGAIDIVPYSLHEYGYETSPIHIPSGGIEVWCSPKTALPALPAQPPLPAVREVDGLREVELPGLPGGYRFIAPSAEGLAIMVSDYVNNEHQHSLWRLSGSDGPQPTPVPLGRPPMQCDWDQLTGHPSSRVLWLRCREKKIVLRRDAAGAWKTFDLSKEASSLAELQALADGEAAMVIYPSGSRAAGPAQPPTEPELQRFYEQHSYQYIKPESVVLEQFVFEIDFGQGMKEREDKARKAAAQLRQALEQPGADLEALRSQPRERDTPLAEAPKIITVPLESCDESEKNLRQALRNVQKGALIGPLELRQNWKLRVLIGKVRDRRPRQLEPFSQVREQILDRVKQERARTSPLPRLIVLGANGIAASREVLTESWSASSIVALPDGFLLTVPRLRYQGGAFLEKAPLLQSLALQQLDGAAALAGQLHSFEARSGRLVTQDIVSGRAMGTTQACLGFGDYSFQQLDRTKLRVLRGFGRDSTLESITVSDVDLRNGSIAPVEIRGPSWLQPHLGAAVVQGDSQWLLDGQLLLRLQGTTWSAFFHPRTRQKNLIGRFGY